MTGERVKRLYLTDRDRYRVRILNGRVVVCRWDDAALTFHTGRGDERRTVDMDRIGACAAFVFEGRATIRWTPWAHCYRAKHRPVVASQRWVHPYAARAA